MMEKILNYSLLKLKRNYIIYITGMYLTVTLNTRAQELSFIGAENISTPMAVSIDRLNQIYIADDKGNISKYGPGGELLQQFSSIRQGGITLIEAWNPLKVFVFQSDYQQYMFLDRFLTTSETFRLTSITSYAGMCTISNDNNLWVVDYANFGIVKYDVTFGNENIRTPFDFILDPDNYEISYLREYQNLLFIVDKSTGILIFDNLGNYLNKLPIANLSYIGFTGSQLYFVKEGMAYWIDIYTLKEKRLKLPKSCQFIFNYDHRLVLITPDQIEYYSIQN